MSIYFILLLASISVPLILSFDKRLAFYKKWKYLLPSLLIVGAVFLFFDICFTKMGVWGFNPLHHSGILFFNLPVEEWLFFIIVPYASIFLHESLTLYFPGLKFKESFSRIITICLMIAFIILALLNVDKIYTLYISVLLVITLLLSLFDRSKSTSRFFITFLIILIPFLVVNGILTGSFISEEVVWYNNNENLGIRFFTIPIEDFGYGFSLILLNLMLSARLRQNTLA